MIGARNFGCYGDPEKVTPNVERLAGTGTRFERAYCASPPCIPARVSVMTGKYAHTHGKMAHLKMELSPRPRLLPETLADHGYRTGLVGKTHWWPPADSLGCEKALITIDNHLTPELGNDDAYIRFLRQRNVFDYAVETWETDRHHLDPDNLPDDCLKVNWTGDTACALLEEFSHDGEPFFLFCSFVEPHGSGGVKREHLAVLRERPLPPIIGEGLAETDKPETQGMAVARWAARSAEEKERYRRGVYASLSLVDANVGKLMDALDRLGLGENTIVFFLSDHGDLMYDHGCVEKTFLYESAIRIPLVIAGPGIPEAASLDQLVSQIDLLPTVPDLCGIDEIPPNIEGSSVRPILTDACATWRDTIYCEVEQTVHLKGLVTSSTAKMLRNDRWKYIYTLVDGGKAEEELYDLQDDPDELCNLAQKHNQQDRIQEYRAALLRWLVATEVNRLHPVPQNHYPVPTVDRTLM